MDKAIYVNPGFDASLLPLKFSNETARKQSDLLLNTRRIYGGDFQPQIKDVSTQIPVEDEGDQSDNIVTARKRIPCSCHVKDGDVNLRELLQYYHGSATIHGIARINDKQFYIFRRPLWLLLVLSMTVMLSWTLYNQMTSLAEHPIKTVTKVSLNSDLAFPAVTLCNLNQYIIDRVPDNPLIQEILYYKSEYSGLVRGFANRTQLSNLDDYPDVPGHEIKRIVHDASPRLEDFLLRCTWRLDVIPCKDIFKSVQTDLGVCFTFNGMDAENATLDRKRARINWSNLRVMVDTQNDKSYFSKYISAGIKVLVHEPDESPYPIWTGWYLRPGVAVSIALDRTDTLRLPAPYKAYKNGYFEDTKHDGYKNPLKRYPIYSTENCISECIMDRLERECGCLSYHASGNITVCSAKQTLTCEIPMGSSINYDDLQSCSCPKTCDQVTYNADVTYADFASMFIQKQALKDNVTFLHPSMRQNTLDVSVFFKTLNVYEVKQEPKLTTETVIGTVGGQMGLFLGASMLSVTELIEVVLLMVVRAAKQCVLWISDRGQSSPSQP